VDITDLEGAWAAADVVDTTTGEVLLEANTELTPTSSRRFSIPAWSR
jgi:hypothetical protein